jgi:uncharacterized protein YecT (DUF1311 family)
MTVIAGVLAALALGLVLGFLTKPKLAPASAATPMRAVTPAAGTLDVEVNPATAPAAVRPAGKLEVLSPQMAHNAERAVPASGPAAAAASPQPIVRQLPEVSPPARLPPPQTLAAQPFAPPRFAPSQTAPADPACSNLRSRAAQMVCADPDLAAADRELNRAYRRAMRSVGSPDQLRDEQRDWLAIREDAARRSPRAVASVYEQRIDELNQIADEDPRD